MKAEQIESIRKSLLNKTGIDFKNYNTQELIDELLDLLNFPGTAIKTIGKPVLILLVITLIVMAIFIYLKKFWLAVLLFTLAGIFTSALCGGLGGLLVLIKKVNRDIREVFEVAFGLTQGILKDIDNKQNVQTKGGATVSEIFNGVIYIIILPAVKSIAKEVIPLVGGVVYKVAERIISSFTSKILAKTTDEEVTNDDLIDKLTQKENKPIQVLQQIHKISDNIIATTGDIAFGPIVLLLGLSVLFCLFMIGLIVKIL